MCVCIYIYITTDIICSIHKCLMSFIYVPNMFVQKKAPAEWISSSSRFKAFANDGSMWGLKNVDGANLWVPPAWWFFTGMGQN